MTTKRKTTLSAMLAAALMAAPATPADGYSCWEDLTLADYDPNLIRAIQQRLQAKGLYAGTIDGKAGRGMRAALTRLTGETVGAHASLTTPMAETLFGPGHAGIYEASDQARLMRKLGVAKDPAHRNRCAVRVVAQ